MTSGGGGGWTWRSARGLVVVVTVSPFLVLPVRAAADVWRAPDLWPQELGWRGLRIVADDPLLVAAVRNSAVVATAAVVIGLLLAWPAARALAAADPRPGLVVVVLGAPLLTPPLAVGQGMSTWLVHLGLDGRWGVVLSHLVYVIPYLTLALVPAFTAELRRQEDAAASLGAGRWYRLCTVTVPGARRSLLLAVALGFTVSWGQYGTTLGAGGGLVTLPVVLVPFVRADPQVAAVLELLLLLPPLAALAASSHDHPAGALDGRAGEVASGVGRPVAPGVRRDAVPPAS